MLKNFTASVWREGDLYIAQCLEIDVASQGESEEESLLNLQEALELYFEEPTSTFRSQLHQIQVNIHAT
jgi:predicted RNase H-like HicB family nuclease